VLRGKHILVGVTGGIAAYKVCYLVRDLKKAGADVKVVMTEAEGRGKLSGTAAKETL